MKCTLTCNHSMKVQIHVNLFSSCTAVNRSSVQPGSGAVVPLFSILATDFNKKKAVRIFFFNLVMTRMNNYLHHQEGYVFTLLLLGQIQHFNKGRIQESFLFLFSIAKYYFFLPNFHYFIDE